MKFPSWAIAGGVAALAAGLEAVFGPAPLGHQPTDESLSPNFTPITDNFLVSGQLTADDIRDAAASGVTLIVNNRPDGEAFGQPKTEELEAAAKAVGVEYIYLPVGMSGITPAHTAALENAVNDAAPGKTLAFCKTGVRSVLARSYAAARFGKPVDQIIEEASRAGFDIAGHRPALTLLQEAGKAPRTDPPV